jgi:hypothetical protein
MGKLCEKGSCEKQDLQSAIRELVAAIDIKWSAESDRKREAALSPRIEAALAKARGLIGPPDKRSRAPAPWHDVEDSMGQGAGPLPVFSTKPVE